MGACSTASARPKGQLQIASPKSLTSPPGSQRKLLPLEKKVTTTQRDRTVSKLNTLIVENQYSVFRTYTSIDIGFKNPACQIASFIKLITIQHNITGVIRFAQILPNEEETRHPYLNWLHGKNLSHPNLLIPYEIYSDKKNSYLVLDYCSGGPLSKLCKNRETPLSEDSIRIIMVAVLQALHYLHSNHLVHGNLSADSFLLADDSTNYQVKLVELQSLCEKPRNSEVIYFQAPEQLSQKPTRQQTDIWAAGVLFYYLITSTYPHQKPGENQDQVKRNILRGCVKFDFVQLERFQKKAIELLKKMLNFEFYARPTALECLQHTWMQKTQKATQASRLKAFEMLKSTKQINQLQACLLLFIVNQYCSRQKETLMLLFSEIDQNKDQKITKVELQSAYMKLYEEQADAEVMVNQIFSLIDHDNSGTIDLDEFLLTQIDRKALLTNKHLEEVFKMIDKDKNGRVSVKEITHICTLNSEIVSKLIKDVDSNSDGCLSIQEFKQLMFQLL